MPNPHDHQHRAAHAQNHQDAIVVRRPTALSDDEWRVARAAITAHLDQLVAAAKDGP